MSGLPKIINFTQVPHFMIDEVMSELSSSEFKVVIVICRKTFGYQKKVDRIALSQFMELTGLAKKTVIDALRSLVKKKIIHKETTITPYQYSINVSNHITSPQQKNINPEGGSIIIPQEVQKVNPSPVQRLNPQKKPIKEKERNTTSRNIKKTEILKVADWWNKLFGNTLGTEKSENIDLIAQALDKFTIRELYQAMLFRSKSFYYQEETFYLRDKPHSFFGYPDTIRNDLKRKPQNVFTYDEMIDLVTSRRYDQDNFSKLEGIKDSEGKELYEYSGPIYS